MAIEIAARWDRMTVQDVAAQFSAARYDDRDQLFRRIATTHSD
jgi:hypothetical protein